MSRPPIVDPQAVPIVGTDAHLPPVRASALTEASLRLRFGAPPDWSPEILGDAGPATRTPTAASVLVPLVLHPERTTLLLTRRTDHLRAHAGQISFPGGRVEADDADAVATALRETHEEVGLDPSRVEVVGTLPAYVTVTSFVVTPVVAFVRPGFALSLDPFEVAEAFEVPLEFVMNPAHHQRHAFEFGGQQREFLSMPWDTTGPDGQPRRYFIWGATAAMLRNFYRFLAG